MHLSSYQLNRYRYARLMPQELLAVDDHLATCEFCRQQLRSGLNVSAALHHLQSPLQLEAGAEHLQPEQRTAFVYNQLDAVERELVTSHLQECADCTTQLQFWQESATDSVPTLAQTLASLWAFLHERAALLWPMPVAALLVVVSVTLVDRWYFRVSDEIAAPAVLQQPIESFTPTPSPSPSPAHPKASPTAKLIPSVPARRAR